MLTGVPEVPVVVTEKVTVAEGLPETVMVLAVGFFTKVMPDAGNPATETSVASPPQVNTISEIEAPGASVWWRFPDEVSVWVLPEDEFSP